MILALNIGNSNITFGSYTPDGKLVFSSRLFADTALSSDELLYKMVNMLALYGAEPQEITAIIFSSVVPALTPRIREALRKMCEAPVMEVGPGLKSGVRIRMDNPAQLGGELLCAVVGALRRAVFALFLQKSSGNSIQISLSVFVALDKSSQTKDDFHIFLYMFFTTCYHIFTDLYQ